MTNAHRTTNRIPPQRSAPRSRPAPYTPTGRRHDQRHWLLEAAPPLFAIIVAVATLVAMGVLVSRVSARVQHALDQTTHQPKGTP